jgi:hypothetical protein
MALPYNAEMLNGYPRISINLNGGTTAEVKIMLPDWSNYADFANYLMGTREDIGGGVYVTQGLTFPGLPQLYVTNIEIEPWGGENARYEVLQDTFLDQHVMHYPNGAVFSIQYSALDNDDTGGGGKPEVPDGTILELEGDIGAEIVEIAGRKITLYEGSDPSKDEQAIEDDWRVHMMMPVEEFTLTWHYVVRPPWATIRNTRGKVNNAAFMAPTGGSAYFAAEQVLFKGAKYSRQLQIGTGLGYWKLVYHFAAQSKWKRNGDPAGWNHVLESDGSSVTDWYKATFSKGLVSDPYLSANFDLLFQYGP